MSLLIFFCFFLGGGVNLYILQEMFAVPENISFSEHSVTRCEYTFILMFQVRNLERAYIRMWDLYCSGSQPQHFKVTEDAERQKHTGFV